MCTEQFCNSLQHHAAASWHLGSLWTKLLVQEEGDRDKFLCTEQFCNSLGSLRTKLLVIHLWVA